MRSSSERRMPGSSPMMLAPVDATMSAPFTFTSTTCERSARCTRDERGHHLRQAGGRQVRVGVLLVERLPARRLDHRRGQPAHGRRRRIAPVRPPQPGVGVQTTSAVHRPARQRWHSAIRHRRTRTRRDGQQDGDQHPDAITAISGQGLRLGRATQVPVFRRAHRSHRISDGEICVLASHSRVTTFGCERARIVAPIA